MNNHKSTFLYLVLVALLVPVFFIAERSSAETQTQPSAASREDAYRLNNIGVALLEQFKHQEAADAFRRALQLQPKLPLAQINLSIALFNLPDLPAAAREAQIAATLAPNAPQPNYILALIAKTQSRLDEAVLQFQKVLKIDPNDVGANINLGQLYSQQRKYQEAIVAFRVALAAEPYNATALYNLGQALMRSGQREEGLKATAKFQELRQRGSATTLGTNYLEQGRYAEAVASTGAELELVDRTTPNVSFVESKDSLPSTSSTAPDTNTPPRILGPDFDAAALRDEMRRLIAMALASGAAAFDLDNDGDLDLFSFKGSEQRLYRNDSGKFTDITGQSPALAAKSGATPTGAIAGDVDNDGRRDLLVTRNGALSLYHNDDNGKFSDVTGAAGIPAYPYLSSSAALVDVDHDGDLDIFIAGLADLSETVKPESTIVPNFAGAPNLLLRNDGTGKFTDITAASGLKASAHTVAIVPTDFNNRRDIDFLIVTFDKPLELFSNQRDGTFRNVSTDAGLAVEGEWTCAAAGDLNKDGFTDFFFGRAADPGLFAISDGKERFKTSPAPRGTEGARAAQFLDYDNDGLLDCVMLTDKGLRVLRNVGDGWVDTSERSVGLTVGPLARSIVAGDIDNDGDEDLILSSDSLKIARNDGGNSNHSLRLNLSGKVSNRSGVGTKVEIRSGSLIQKIETSATTPAVAPADVLFGLGKRSTVDAVRLLWPSGVVQAETEIKSSNVADAGPAKRSVTILPITELDRKPSSCPYLYAWNGERFEFITDFMGGGEMGYLEEPGRHNIPDPTEYVRIRSDQLKERDGRYELRVTNELEEAIFADRFQLIAIDHPVGVEVYPNEGMTDPPRPFKLFVTKSARPPLSAIDTHGKNVLARITTMDRTYPDDFQRDRIRGYAEEHSLTLKLSEDAEHARSREKVVLLLTGWTDYAWSSDNLAASQAGKAMRLPALQVKDMRGKWRTVIENIGIPVGRPQTVTVDLTGKFLSSNREVRIVTSMRILWDQILVDTSQERTKAQMMRLDPMNANLRWRGFSREVTPDGREPFGYNYEKVTFISPWKVMPGRYTREGDVRELLLQTDDMFVIFQPGDEISLSFDARALPALESGQVRSFLLYSDGFSKEMDINSASPDQVMPLPFHGMSRYPYPKTEMYPMTAARRAYMDRYNTRLVTAELPSINSLISTSAAR